MTKCEDCEHVMDLGLIRFLTKKNIEAPEWADALCKRLDEFTSMDSEACAGFERNANHICRAILREHRMQEIGMHVVK